jgi:type II secretory pathway pseudopilin PulG
MELMVVMAVMLLVMGSAFSFMKSAINVSNATYELTEAQENLRTAHEYISRDILTAGDGLNGISSIQVAQGFVNNYLAKNVIPDPTKPGYVNLPIIGSDANVPGSTVVTMPAPTPPVNVLANTDRITLLALDPTFVAIPLGIGTILANGLTVRIAAVDLPRFTVGEIYCFTSQSGATFGTVTAITGGATPSLTFDAPASYGLNAPGVAGPLKLIGAANPGGVSTQPVTLQRVRMINYYVNARNEFVKRVFGVPGTGYVDNLIAEHVTNLKFRYILGSNNPDGSVQQPLSQLTNSTQQVAVRFIETTITAETTHPVNFLTGARAQSSMVTTTTIRNMQFRQARQPKAGE